MPDILLSFKRLTLRWAFISIVSAGGLAAVYTWRQAEHVRAGLTFYLGIGLILASGLGFGICWYALRSARLPAKKPAGWLPGALLGPA